MKLLITVLKMKYTSMTRMVLYKRYVCLPYIKNDSRERKENRYQFPGTFDEAEVTGAGRDGGNILISATSTYAPPMISGNKIEKLVMAESSTSH